ncbi:hypothetical protein MmiAt1_09940 [Methanimicrococcus sp. At1]|uniref:Tryptophan--tRNA ligase n=1 Tax=Methanimicrococcus hacksteinii TaxID=3028293 RepID=A0ABU3VPR6_9EURY|nr:tryptophan--tRNA ligase [Methanimicrococcus sp. At1]MDV0445417.1 hypothetical protein [Methanimicrococcus sp. At1]
MAQKLDPWKSSEISDYSKLFDEFGIQPFAEVLDDIPDPHKYMRRGIIFGHRGYDMIADAIRNKKPFVVLDGFMPTGKAHFGHKMVMDQIVWYQKQGGIAVIGMADREAHAVRDLSWDECKKIGVEEYITSLIALGLQPENTRIYFQSESPLVKDLAFELGTKVNFSEMAAIYGFSGETHLAHMIAVLTQGADILHSQLPTYGGPIPVVVPVGADQDPHIRLTRDIATKMDMFTIDQRIDQKTNKPYWSVRGKNAPEKALREINAAIYEKFAVQLPPNNSNKLASNNNSNVLGNTLTGAALGGVAGAIFGGLFSDSVDTELFDRSLNIRGKIPENDLFGIINHIESVYRDKIQPVNDQELGCQDGEMSLFFINRPVGPNGKQYWCITIREDVPQEALVAIENEIKSRFRSLADNILLGAAAGGLVGGAGGALLGLATPSTTSTKPSAISAPSLTKLSKEHIDIFVDINRIELETIVRRVEYNNGGYAFILPASTYHRFMSGLTGGKMSSSIPDSNIALSEEPKSAAKKIMKAKTGGRESADEQRELGGEFDKCSVYELYLFHLVDDDAELIQIQNECKGGKILCGECKKKAAGKMESFLTDLQQKREEAFEKLPLYGIDYKRG